MPRSRRPPHVHKFGGASLADSTAVRHAVDIIRRHAQEPTVVVVSAMAGTTDALLGVAQQAGAGESRAVAALIARLRSRHAETARAVLPAGRLRADLLASVSDMFAELEALAEGLRLLRELTPRTTDYLVARGERLSARLVAAALEAAGTRARYVDALDLVHTDGAFGQAAPDFARTDRSAARTLLPLLARGLVPVVPGFIGATPGGEVATLGRGGSDLTATLLARALSAARVSLWKDVPGLLTADPRVVPDARVIPQLHAREAAELAYYGAKVLHPRTLIPVAGRRIPVHVRPFGDPDAPGTEVSERVAPARFPVKALTAAGGQALVTVTGNGMLGVPGIAARTFASLQARRISVSLISQASSEHSICFSVPEPLAAHARESLEREFAGEIARGEIDGVELGTGMATVAVVGLGMQGTPGVAAAVFSALAAARINVVAIAQGSSELNISVVVEARQAAEAQRRIHAAFQLSRIAGGGVIQPERMELVLLGFGQIGRTLAGMIGRVRRPALDLRVAAVIDRSGFVFDPQGLGSRRLAALAAEKKKGRRLAELPRARAATAEEAVRHVAGYALTRPVLVDLTAHDTAAALELGLTHGMDLVLANKLPLAGRRGMSDSLWQTARARGRRILHEATVGAGLPIIDTYHKLTESGDRVERIEGAALRDARLRPRRRIRRRGVLTRGAERDAARLYRAGPARGPVRHGCGAKGAHPGAPPRLSRGALAIGGGVARAQMGPRDPAGRVSRATPGTRRRLAPPRRGRREGRHGAPLRGHGDPVEDRRRAPAGVELESARGPQGVGQPGRLHHGPVQGQPAGDHRSRRGRRGDGGRGAE